MAKELLAAVPIEVIAESIPSGNFDAGPLLINARWRGVDAAPILPSACSLPVINRRGKENFVDVGHQAPRDGLPHRAANHRFSLDGGARLRRRTAACLLGARSGMER